MQTVFAVIIGTTRRGRGIQWRADTMAMVRQVKGDTSAGWMKIELRYQREEVLLLLWSVY